MQVKKKKLKEIVDISLGHSFRGKIEGNDNGNIFVIQAKDVKDNYIISDFDKLAKIHHSINIEKILKKGDILLSNRGYFNATLFNLGKDTIAASSVYILKPKKDIFLPEYLVI